MECRGSLGENIGLIQAARLTSNVNGGAGVIIELSDTLNISIYSIFDVYRELRYDDFIDFTDKIIMQPLTTLTQLQHAIVARRKKLKLSQAKVAGKLGISQNRYSELEASVANLDADRLLRLLSVLGLELQLGLKAESLPLSQSGSEW